MYSLYNVISPPWVSVLSWVLSAILAIHAFKAKKNKGMIYFILIMVIATGTFLGGVVRIIRDFSADLKVVELSGIIACVIVVIMLLLIVVLSTISYAKGEISEERKKLYFIGMATFIFGCVIVGILIIMTR